MRYVKEQEYLTGFISSLMERGVEETLARDMMTGDAEMETLELAEDLDLAAGDVALVTRTVGGRLAVRRAEP